MTVPPGVRTSSLLVAARTVHSADPLTRMVAESIADEVLEDLSWALSPRRAESELNLLNSLSADHSFAARVSPTLAAVLEAAVRAEQVSGGWYRPIRTADAEQEAPDLEFDPTTRRLVLPRGTQLDLHDVGCAWAAERILERMAEADPFASLAVQVGPAVASVGAAWEISEALEGELTILDPALQRGQRSFAVLEPSDEAEQASSGAERRQRTWGTVAVAAQDAVAAVAMAGAAEELGRVAPEWIETVGGQGELRPQRSHSVFGRRRVRTSGWAARGL